MRIQKASQTFAGLTIICPHCHSGMFPNTLRSHIPSFTSPQVRELYVKVKDELQVYVAQAKVSGETKASLYGNDLGILFKLARAEMMSRNLLTTAK